MDNMPLILGLWLIIFHLYGLVLGFCLYGDSPDCVFPCHCAVKTECRRGICASGCEEAPLGHNWRGPGCQIGNVGLHKLANMTECDIFSKIRPVSGVVDGINPTPVNGSCTHASTETGKQPQIWIDLGAVYKIYNITMYGFRNRYADKLQQFNLTVYNTSDNQLLCGYHEHIVNTSYTIDCRTPLIGRYVHFTRKGGVRPNVANLCEMVIIGHKYIDCSRCPSAVSCNEVTGCQQCDGSYQPDCTRGCDDGFYGINCQNACGKCTNSCDRQSGVCIDGCLTWWINPKCDTEIEIPAHTNESVTLQSKTSNSIHIEWQKIPGIPTDVQQFYGYLIEYKEAKTVTSYTLSGRVNYKSSAQWNIEDLQFNTVYDILLTPFRRYENLTDFSSPYQPLTVKTDCSAPDRPTIENITTVSKDSAFTNISITWQMTSSIDPHCDNITNIFLFYKRMTSTDFTSILLLPDINTFIINITEAGQYDVKLIVENNEGYTSSSEIYTIIIEDVSVQETTSSSSLPAIGGGVSVAVLMTLIVVIIVILWRRRMMNKNSTSTFYENTAFQSEGADVEGLSGVKDVKTSVADVTSKTDEENPEENIYANSLIPVAKFGAYVLGRKENIEEFYDEYKSLPQPDTSRCNVSLLPDNKLKNRYRTIFAYDENRVILHDDENNDYINASYITGYNTEKEYIATQGAKKNTCVDFWRMVWQEKSNRVVMVTNITEMGKNKVYPYWPEDIGNSLKVGGFVIKTEALNKTVDNTVRIMTVKKGHESRTVYQLHFTSWEDKGKPRYGIHTLQAFINKVHSFDKFSKGPLIVHCSAGVGRTGTFIALDILQQMALNEPVLDVFGCVQKLRNERMLMVQTKVQYVYLHEALADFIKCGNKSVDCIEFQRKFATVCNPEPEKELLLLVKNELQMLRDIINLSDDSEKNGLKPENINKNRNRDIIPDNCHGLWLSRSKTGNYINAVTVDSFKVHDCYVVTQMPLPHTIDDFWQLIIEQECQAIVMLNEIHVDDKTCRRYWPEDVNTKGHYGNIQVELKSVDVQDFLIIRDMKVTEMASRSNKPQVLDIRQFQLLSWPDMAVQPPNRGHLLELTEGLQKWQHQKEIPSDKWKPLIHCIDGGSRSGMFCGASFLLDRMKIEQDVNAFLAVRYVTRHRPEFFTKPEEYMVLYQVAMEYLTRNNEYANFS